MKAKLAGVGSVDKAGIPSLQIFRLLRRYVDSYRVSLRKKRMLFDHNILLKSNYVPKEINTRKEHRKGKSVTYSHLAAFSQVNAGDILLPRCVQDSFLNQSRQIDWRAMQISLPYAQKHIDRLNATDGIVIGGGGVFLQRKNLKLDHPSEWHWSCSMELTRQIRVPVAFFAVGYNQFRSHGKMPPKFKRHLASFADRIVFVGMRNTGSMEKIREYLPEEKHDCIAYQPCPTTVIKCLYPGLFEQNGRRYDRPVLGLNCAFDRPEARFQGKQDNICSEIAAAIGKLSDKFDIHYVIHSPQDDLFLPYLTKHNVPYQVVNLVNTNPRHIVQYYQQLSIMLGMRGHSQMVPFGCGIPIISLISHDKLKWFLQDIDREDWGIEVQEKQIKRDLIDKVEDFYAREHRIRRDIVDIQQGLWEATNRNVNKVINEFQDYLPMNP